jgi:hypothetical protein
MPRPFSKLELTYARLEAEGGPDLVLMRRESQPRHEICLTIRAAPCFETHPCNQRLAWMLLSMRAEWRPHRAAISSEWL